MVGALASGILALAFQASDAARASEDDEPVPIQRYLESVRLGDYLKEIRLVYPPVRDWPFFKAPGGTITRYQVERAYAKHFPWELDVLRLGMRWGRLVHIQAIYADRFAKEKPLEKLVVDLSMRYGEPSRRGLIYSWQDRRTVLRVFNEEIRAPDGKAVEMRPSIEIFDRDARTELR